MRGLLLLALLCHIGVVRCQIRTKFYTKLSPGCIEANISEAQDCPVRNRVRSRWNVTSVKNTPRFKTYLRRKYKCYYKLIERELTCKTIPSCVMTTYSYALPRPAKNVKAIECTNAFSIATNCNANGLDDLKTVYSECFKKGQRSFCTIDFRPCKSFQWTKFLPQCLVPCETSGFSGVAERLIRKCMSHDGKFVDEENCSGGLSPSKVSETCLQTHTIKTDISMCNVTSVSDPTVNYSASNEQTTTGFLSTTKPAIQAVSTVTGPRSKPTSASITAAETRHVFNSSKFNDVTSVPPDVTVYNTFPGTKNKIDSEISPRILLSESDSPEINSSLEVMFSDVSVDGSKAKTFDLLPVAGGAGAGLVVVIILALIIVLLVRRRDHKSSAVNSILSSTSSYRTKSGRNPVVDSGSFRIATWIRERPSLPNGGTISPSESVVSDAEYWKVGESYDDLTARYVQDRRDSKTSEVPDVVKNVCADTGQGIENEYDEVYSSDKEDAPTTSNRFSTPILNCQSSSSNQSQNERTVMDTPFDKNAVHAAIQKSRRREQMRKRSSAASIGGARKRIASQHSVTNLNERQLRDGVLRIEFDDEQGVKCKLSESDVYIDLEEDELPSVF